MAVRWGATAAKAVALSALLLSSGGTPASARARGQKRPQVTEIIIHATGGPSCNRGQVVFSPAGDIDRMKRFFEASALVSIHYIVGRDGRVVASVPEDEVAIHTVGRNDQSIGIELINEGDGRDAYPAEQIAALARLVHAIRSWWRLPVSEVKGHQEVDHSTFACGGRAVRRKQDPGPLFPWDRLHLDLMVAAEVPPTRVRK